MNWRDIGVRAAKTAAQAALSLLTVDALFGGRMDLSLLQQAGLAALAAGYAVVWNALLAWARS
jgi:hypothetical protein